ncbi:hypothetical protein [Elizabethkingia argenteiflava]|nr:hypothetical protein [Elizabethkingia argenteiflava]
MIFPLVSCNKNYYTEYKAITYDELPKEVRAKTDSIVSNYSGEGYMCYDLSSGCKDCRVHNDDEGMLGLLINRRPHIVINACNKVYEVPITFQGALFFIYENKIYFPYITYFEGDLHGSKKIKEYLDIKKLEYRVVDLKN